MGLMQSAYETYEAVALRYVGDYGFKEVLAPVSHIVTRADIQITIDVHGRFISAVAIGKNASKIIIPATEKSAGRTAVPEPHPLCEQLGYFTGMDSKKRALYIEQLTAWAQACRHPTLLAVLTYVKGGTLLDDLTRADLLQYDDKGGIKNDKALICWRVEGSPTPDCWKDKTLFDAFIQYYEEMHAADKKAICMMGGNVERPAVQHPKGIVAINGNAKLISANDGSGFTYRGRFTQEEQALTVSYKASQKAHAALRWLVANQGVSAGSRTFVCWNPQGQETPNICQPLLFRQQEPIIRPSDYHDQLRKTLNGWQLKLPETANVVIATFDAATTGRLSLIYFNELQASDLLKRLVIWDDTCCWWNGLFGVQSPALYNIASYAFGSRRDLNRIECDERVLKQHIQRLIACRVDCMAMPQDIVCALVEKCQNLGLYESGMREKLLSTTCAVIRKYYNDINKGEWILALEPNRRDYSYQYGRLLAILEKAEQDTYDPGEKRLTNAIRLQPMFVRQPQHTFAIVLEQLKKAYYPRLHPAIRTRYEQLIGDILCILSECMPDSGTAALSDSYLLGYYLQKKELYTKHDKKEEEEE